MSKYINKNLGSPTNECVREDTPPEQLRYGVDSCETTQTGNKTFDEMHKKESVDGYHVKFVSEGEEIPQVDDSSGQDGCPPSSDKRGYHKLSAAEFVSGQAANERCASPYSRYIMQGGGLSSVVKDREEQLLRATGKPVVLLRRQYTGRRCPCYDTNRGRSKIQCTICYGTSFIPGYIPYINQKDPLGRIFVRFEPYEEDLALKEQGLFQEVNISCWTLSAPIVRQRDIIIGYEADGLEEYRYEIMRVTRNELFSGSGKGAQKFTIKRLDPTQSVYKFDPFKIPDLTDIIIQDSDLSSQALEQNRIYDQLSTTDDGVFTNIEIENVFGDGAFSGMFVEGYKIGYQTNFVRALNFQAPLPYPDFDENGTLVNDGYGPIFYSSTNKRIKFSTPQQIQDNVGTNPLEVIQAEKKKQFVNGYVSGAKHGWQDGQRELRARGLI